MNLLFKNFICGEVGTEIVHLSILKIITIYVHLNLLLDLYTALWIVLTSLLAHFILYLDHRDSNSTF